MTSKSSKTSSATIKDNPRTNFCFTCGFVPMNIDEKKGMKQFCSNLVATNIRLGEVLKRSGTKTGHERTWGMKRCCAKCWFIQNKWNRARETIEILNVQWMERTSHHLPTVSPAQNHLKLKSDLLKFIQVSKYKSAFRILLGKKSVREAWIKEIAKTVRREFKELQKEPLYPPCAVGKQLGAKEWKPIFRRLKKIAPVFYAVAVASMTKNEQQQAKLARKAKDRLSSRIGMMINIPLGTRGPMRYQGQIAVNLWHLGANEGILKYLHSLGLSKLKRETLELVQRRKILGTEWCEKIEKEENSSKGDARDKLHPGFSLMVKKRYDKYESNARTTQPKPGRQSRLVSSGVAVKNRISFRDLQEEAPKKACELPLTIYLPKQSDYEELRMRMQVMVERILQANLSLFANQSVTGHIPHKYSSQCAEKSEYVDLGIIEGNHVTSDQASDLLQKLEDHAPKGYPLVLYGHEEMVKNASIAQASSAKGTARQALIPVPQDGNLRSLFMRDIMADLYVPTSPTERATLRNLIHMFGHDGIKDKHSPPHLLDDFLLFVCCAMVVGFALEVLISNEDEMSDGEPATLLNRLSAEVVRRVWHQMPMNQVADIVNAEVKSYEGSESKFCFCKEDREGERMLECSNVNCKNGNWFHELCVSNPEMSDDWYCSPTCRSLRGGQYCVCRMKTEEELVWTCANKKCKRGRKFHHGCVRSTLPVPQQTSQKKWYCSAHCQKGKNVGEDRELRYLEAVTWRCLFNECMRDAEREGDGEALMGYWRIYMPELFKRGHDLFFLAAHRLLAGISGCYEPRIRQEVIHNRTMNFDGGAGKNFSLDLQNTATRFCRRSKEAAALFKKKPRGDEDDEEDMGKAAGDPLTKKRKLDRDRVTDNDGDTTISNRYAIFKGDVAEFQKKFGDDELFKETRGRCIPSLMSKSFDQDFTRHEMAGMKKRLLTLIKEYDEGPASGKQFFKKVKPRKEDPVSSDDGKEENKSEDEEDKSDGENSEEEDEEGEDKSSNDEDEDEDEDDDNDDDGGDDGDDDDDDDDDEEEEEEEVEEEEEEGEEEEEEEEDMSSEDS